MPIYTYQCSECGGLKKHLAEASNDNPRECIDCGGLSVRQLPSEVSSMSTELKDKYRGKQVPKDLDKMMKKRSVEHTRKHEAAELIDKHGLNEGKKKGWVK